MGRQPAGTRLSSNVTVRRVRVRGGNFKFRALRLDAGNYSWGSEVSLAELFGLFRFQVGLIQQKNLLIICRRSPARPGFWRWCTTPQITSWYALYADLRVPHSHSRSLLKPSLLDQQVRTNTLVKNAIVQIDSTPFKQYYAQHYGVELGTQRKIAAGATEETKEEEVKRSSHLQKKLAARNKVSVLGQ